MMIDLVLAHVLPAAYSLLPPAMDTPRASAELLAIGLQESQFLERAQIGGGPARGFWQFERVAVLAVLTHRVTGPLIYRVLEQLRYDPRATTASLHAALEDNDVLAACCARLLLWTDWRALPARTDPDLGWISYLWTWHPGKPRPETWAGYFREAWERVEAAPPRLSDLPPSVRT